MFDQQTNGRTEGRSKWVIEARARDKKMDSMTSK